MKFKQVIEFIENYYKTKVFEKGLKLLIDLSINKERGDVYEKCLLYLTSLSEDDKKFIKDRLEKNRKIFTKRQEELILLIKSRAFTQDFADEPDYIPRLSDYLDGNTHYELNNMRQEVNTNYNIIQRGVNTQEAQPIMPNQRLQEQINRMADVAVQQQQLQRENTQNIRFTTGAVYGTQLGGMFVGGDGTVITGTGNEE